MNRMLSNENIDAACRAVETFLSTLRLSRETQLRLRLSVEEVLMCFQTRFGSEKPFDLQMGTRMRRPYLRIRVVGESFNPLQTDETWDSPVLDGLLADAGLKPQYSYASGVNLVMITPAQKKRSSFFALGIALVLAIFAGFCGKLAPDSVTLALSQQLLTPIFDSFMGLLSAISGPLIFLSVAWGIYSIGDTATLGRIGKAMIVRILLMMVLLTALFTACILPFYTITTHASTDTSFGLGALLTMLLDMIPRNFIAPFLENNPMQIIFIAIAFGLCMLILSSKSTVVAAFIEQIHQIVSLVMSALSALLPVFIFVSLVRVIWGGNMGTLLQSYKPLVLTLAGSVMSFCVYWVLICVRKRLSPMRYLRKILPTMLIAFTTASSSAALSSNMDCCTRRLGIDGRIVSFGVPLGQIIFMPGAAILFICTALSTAEIFGVAITVPWVILAFLLCVILGIAAPPIPGGMLTCFTILFLQLGIPAEAITIAIALNLVFDFIMTATDICCLQGELTLLSDQLGMLDDEILRAP